MKKFSLILLLSLMVFLLPGRAWALTTPIVSQGHGVVTAFIVQPSNLQLGVEYGLNSQLGLNFNLGHYNRFGVKYEVSPVMAVLGGITDGKPFIGVNGAHVLARNVVGIYEVSVVTGEKVDIMYQTGVRLNLDQPIDLRIGLISKGVFSPRVQLGIGYTY